MVETHDVASFTLHPLRLMFVSSRSPTALFVMLLVYNIWEIGAIVNDTCCAMLSNFSSEILLS